MARYTLTKNYSEIAESCGLFQNSSGNAEIEITNDVAEAGIVLRPFQSVIINQKVYARKLGNAGACLLTVLPFEKLWEDTTAVPPKRCDENADSEISDEEVTFDEYGNLFLHNKHRAPPLSVQETPNHYVVKVSKESLKGQNKFLIQFDDKKGK